MRNKMLQPEQIYHVKQTVWPEKYQLHPSSQLILDSKWGGISCMLKLLVTEYPAKTYCIRHRNSNNLIIFEWSTTKWWGWVQILFFFLMALIILSRKFRVFWDHNSCLSELCYCLITAAKTLQTDDKAVWCEFLWMTPWKKSVPWEPRNPSHEEEQLQADKNGSLLSASTSCLNK